jgi:hypothetical protein
MTSETANSEARADAIADAFGPLLTTMLNNLTDLMAVLAAVSSAGGCPTAEKFAREQAPELLADAGVAYPLAIVHVTARAGGTIEKERLNWYPRGQRGGRHLLRSYRRHGYLHRQRFRAAVSRCVRGPGAGSGQTNADICAALLTMPAGSSDLRARGRAS